MGAEYAVSMALNLKDGVTGKFKAMSKHATLFGQATERATTRANRNLSRMMTTAKGFVTGSLIRDGINLISSSVRGLTDEWASFDDASRFAASKFEEVQTGAMSFADALKETKRTSLEVGGATMFTAAQVARAMDNLALSGYTLSQSQASIMEITKFATLAQMDLTDATEAATGALGAFGLKTKDSEQLGKNFTYLMDVMTATFTTSRMNLEDLSNAITAGGAAFVTSSQDIETFNTLLWAMAEGGIVSETAGMRMRAMINRLGKPTKDAAAALRELNMQVSDPKTGNFRPMLDIVNQLRTGLAGKGTVERGAFIKRIFGERNITAMNLILNKSQSQLEEYFDSLKNAAGSADAQLGRVQGSIIQRAKILTSALTEKFFTSMESGEGVIGTSITALSSAVQRLDMTKIQSFVSSNLPTVITTLSGAFNELKSPLLVALRAFGGIVSLLIQMSPILVPLIGLWARWKIVMMAFGAISSANLIVQKLWNTALLIDLRLIALEIAQNGILAGAKYALTAAQLALNAAMGANPIALVIVAVAALAAGLWYVASRWDDWGFAIKKTWRTLRWFVAFFSPAFALITGIVIDLIDNWGYLKKSFAEKGVWGGLVDTLKVVGRSIIDFMLTPLDLVLRGLNKIGVVSDEALHKYQEIRGAMMESMSVGGKYEITGQQVPGLNNVYQSVNQETGDTGMSFVPDYNTPQNFVENTPSPNAAEVGFQQVAMNGRILIENQTELKATATFDSGITAVDDLGLN